MSVEVEIYRAPDYISVGRLPLAPLLNEVFEPLLGRDLTDAQFVLHLSAIEETEPIPGCPVMVNLRNSHGYGQVTIIMGGRVIYQHPHALSEIVAAPLQHALGTRLPDVDEWGFALVGQGLEDLSRVRPVPRVAGGVHIAGQNQRRRASRVEEIPDPEPPVTTLSQLGVRTPDLPYAGPIDLNGTEPGPPVTLALRPSAYEKLHDGDFSDEVEEGGFVIGHRHRDADNPDRYLLEVTEVVRAESTGASLLRFTFTGESFLRLGDLLARRANHEEILGWYHTHLFSATPEFGLSTIDVRLHTTTFRRPWQVAALVNLGYEGRVLRWYGCQPGGTDLREIPYWVASDDPQETPPPVSTASEK
jgi:proteasome lid subunit RPN8/RPN11